MSSLWYTPLQPLLFLTSAFAVGYPMVVVETTIATSSLKLESEMDVLTPLSRITILLLGIYMAIKIGDLVYRGAYVTLLDGSAQSNAFLIEVGLGVVVPWTMLLFKRVRQSRRLLFTSAFMIVTGVMLNRFNVFVVSFKAPFATSPYYPRHRRNPHHCRGRGHHLLPVPDIRDLLPGDFRPTTGGIIMIRHTLMWLALCVVVAVTGVTVPVRAATTPAPEPKPVEKSRKDVTPKPEGWMAKDQVEAEELAIKTYPYVDKILEEDLPLRQQRLREQGIGLKDIKHTYLMLDSPYVNTYENKYGPVRFMHAKHAASLEGDCAACHHYPAPPTRRPEKPWPAVPAIRKPLPMKTPDGSASRPPTTCSAWGVTRN